MIQNLISGSEWKACQMLVGVWLLVSWKMMRMMVLGQVIKKNHISSNKCPCTNRALPRLTTYTLGQNIKQVPPVSNNCPPPLPYHFF